MVIKIPIKTQQDVVIARKTAKEIMESNGFGPASQTRMATAISELTRNVVRYADEGMCTIEEVHSPEEVVIRAIIEDNGPGIEDIDRALEDGFSSGNSLGAGLPGARRLVNDFDISSNPGYTRVVMEIQRSND